MNVARHMRQLSIETIIYGTSSGIGSLVAVFLVPLYTRVFSPEEYGRVALLTSLVSLATTFIVLGMDGASARWYYDDADPMRRRQVISSWFWCQTAVGALLTLVMVLLAPRLAHLVLGSAQYAVAVVVATLTIPLSTFSKVIGNWLRYERLAWKTTVFFALNSLISVALVAVCLLWLRMGMTGLFAGQAAAGVLTGAIALALIGNCILPRYISRPMLGAMFAYAFPLIPAALAAWVTASADRFILKGFVPTSEIGVYAVGVSLASSIMLIISGFRMAWGPFAYSIMDKPEAGNVYRNVLSLYSLVGCFLATALSLYAPQLLYVLTTERYYGATSTVPYLAFGYLAIGAFEIVAIGANAAKKSRPVAATIFLAAGVNTGLNFVLIPFLGKNGAAISTFAAYTAATICMYFASQHRYPIPYRTRDSLVCLAFSWTLIIIDHCFVPTWGLAAIVVRALMCLSFGVVALWLGLIRPQHILMLYAYARQRTKGAAA